MKTQTIEQRVKELEEENKWLRVLLVKRPPRQTISDQRYWSWDNLVVKALDKVEK